MLMHSRSGLGMGRGGVVGSVVGKQIHVPSPLHRPKSGGPAALWGTHLRNQTRFVWVALGVLLLSACEIPQTPHTVGSVTDDCCLQCHRNGDYEAPRVSHPDWSHCVSCHEAPDYRPVPHTMDVPDCLTCHGPGVDVAPNVSHPGRPDCASCHNSAN
jgi:hypothetical protein